jgi:hypothetical protein
MIREAIKQRRSLNLVRQSTMYKVDFFLRADLLQRALNDSQ